MTKANQNQLNDQMINAAKMINAVKKGNLVAVKKLHKQGVDIHACDGEAFYWAARNGYNDVVRYLVENGVNIHTRDDHTFRWAAGRGHIDVVRYLVENGANIHARNDQAFRWAAYNGHFDVVAYIINQCKPNKQKALEWHKTIVKRMKTNDKAIVAMVALAEWLNRSG